MIKNFDGIKSDELERELELGARFVTYDYCISLLIVSFQRSSDPVFVRHNESAAMAGLPWTMLSLVMGWWGIPFGVIFTIMSLYTNFRGGRDVTDEVLYQLGY